MATLIVPQGSEWGYRWPVTPDPSNCTVRGQIRATVDAAEVLYEWDSVVTGNARANADEGVVILIPSAHSSAFTWREGVADVEVTTPEGATYRIAKFRVEIDPEVTR